MKKSALAIALALCVSLALVFTGCGANENPYSKYNLEEYVKVPEYKGMEREEINVSVTEDEIQDRIESNLQSDATTEEKKQGTVKDGDKVNIDYVGTLNGKVFDGGTAEKQDLVIGSGSFIPGFEDGLIGKKIGSTVKLNLTFPKQYEQNPDLAGKDVVFEVTINSVKEEVVPEFTEEWVANNTSVKSRKAYRARVERKLREEKKSMEVTNQKNEMWQQILEESEVKKFPEEEVNAYIKQIEKTYQQVAEESGMELEDVLKQYGINSMEDYDAENKTTAQTYVKQQMVLYYVAGQEGLSYTEDEEKALRSEIEQAGYDEESFQQAMGQSIDEYVSMSLTYSNVVDFIYKNAKVVEVDEKKAKEKAEQDALDNRGGDQATSNDQAGGADA